MPAYCNPPGQPSVVNRHAKWPSLERIEAADVHVHALPKAALGDIVKRLPNRTFMLMGDSVPFREQPRPPHALFDLRTPLCAGDGTVPQRCSVLFAARGA